MKFTLWLGAVLALAAAAVPLTSAAAATDSFRNGQSYFGEPSSQMPVTRTVELGTASHLNVAYGETVRFQSMGQQFTWTFNGLDRRAVDVIRIAPAGFPVKSLVVHVGRNPTNRGR